MRMYAVYHKNNALSFISHLDIQRTLQRAFRRAGIPLAYSEGFNPHPRLSFAAAVPTGSSSDCEWFEVYLDCDMTPEAFMARTNACLPESLYLTDAALVPEGAGKLTKMVCAADYAVRFSAERALTAGEAGKALDAVLAGPIVVDKNTKGGIKAVDIRPQIIAASVRGEDEGAVLLDIQGRLTVDGGLRVEHLTDALAAALGVSHAAAEIHRTAMYFEPDAPALLPRLPAERLGVFESNEQGDSR